MSPAVRSVALANGITLPVATQGDPSGLPVVLLHGFTDSWRSFEPVLPHLPDALFVVAPTQRGHGDADRPLGGYRPRDFAGDLRALLDALGIEAAVVAGHSMGSLIAQRFAIEHPARTLGLVLVGAFLRLRGEAAVADLDAALAAMEDPVDPDFVRAFREGAVARPVPAAFLDMVVRESLRVPAWVWRAAWSAMSETDHSGEFGAIAAPTLVLWGDRDGVAPRAQQEALASSIPGARLLVHAGAGHAPHWEDPAGFAAELAAFARRAVRDGLSRFDHATRTAGSG